VIFEIAETETFSKSVKKQKLKPLLSKIESAVYPLLRENPFFGPNIKKLRGEFHGVYRYRVGDYRLFYLVDESEQVVIVLDLRHRGAAY